MPRHSFSMIYLHITFHTKDNLRVIRGKLRDYLYDYLRSRAAKSTGVKLEAVGGTDDHAHLAARVPPTLLISDWIGQMKGASSHYINQLARRKVLDWQDGYGVVSFGADALPDVCRYIAEQEEHHARGTVREIFERTSEE